jgi:hypothetical protein
VLYGQVIEAASVSSPTRWEVLLIINRRFRCSTPRSMTKALSPSCGCMSRLRRSNYLARSETLPIEPPHGGIKFRCLTDLPCSGTGRCIRRRNSSLWRPRRLDHNARRDAPLSCAQFEREGFGERIRDKIAASNRKCGGCLLLALQSQFSEHLAILWLSSPFT